jgi:hypothetical protein
MAHLSEAFIRSLRPPDELPAPDQLIVFDHKTPGLALRVTDTGRKTFLWQDSIAPRPEVRFASITLGEWPRDLSVRQARRLAIEVRTRIRSGEAVEQVRVELKQRRAESK